MQHNHNIILLNPRLLFLIKFQQFIMCTYSYFGANGNHGKRKRERERENGKGHQVKKKTKKKHRVEW